MRLCRFKTADGVVRIGLLDRVSLAAGDHEQVRDLSALGVQSLTEIFERPQIRHTLKDIAAGTSQRFSLAEIKLLPPVERQEVWAAGVTYLRSKKARMEESEFSANAYDKVYEAPRPELFFKSQPEKVSGPGGPVGIRADARWNVPEPELALVINSRGELIGFTIGNDMSSRDIEGENLLYLPQAKIYRHSCALGPFITLADEPEARDWDISLKIVRGGDVVFSGSTRVAQIKRSFGELIEYLFRSQDFPNGAILLTGTGVVPADDFTLRPGDTVTINISGIGTLTNAVEEV